MPQPDEAIASIERIDEAILTVRGQRVLLDVDLAVLYQVETRALNQAVARNSDRFPGDFMFLLTREEWADLRSQTVISKGPGGRRRPPHAFTEQGVAMLSSVLRSGRAVRVNIEIMRAFVRLRRWTTRHTELAAKIAAMEGRYDAQFRVVFDAIKRLLAPPTQERRKIGFRGGHD